MSKSWVLSDGDGDGDGDGDSRVRRQSKEITQQVSSLRREDETLEGNYATDFSTYAM